MIVRILFYLFSLLFLCHCSQPQGHNERQETFRYVDQEVARQLGAFSYSTAPQQVFLRLQAESVLLNSRDPLHVRIHGQFLQDDSTMIIHTYTSNLMRNDGTSLEVVPDMNARVLKIQLFNRDFQQFTFCEIPNSLNNNREFQIAIQYDYNSANGPRIMIWNMYIDGRAEIKKNFEFLSEKTADCSTTNNVFFDHFGQGRLWGLDLHSVKLVDVKRSEAL